MVKQLAKAAMLASFFATATLPSLAQTTPPASPDTTTLACVQQAVDKRETAIGTALTAYTQALTTAFQKRHTDLVHAWTLTDKKERRAAIRTAWKDWKTSARQARRDFKTARRAAWVQYRADIKVCRATATDESIFGGTFSGENAVSF